MAKIQLAHTGDWHVAVIDGRLICEGHSFRDSDHLEILRAAGLLVEEGEYLADTLRNAGHEVEELNFEGHGYDEATTEAYENWHAGLKEYHGSPYCPRCGSCGITGCCGVHCCPYVKAHEGDYNDLVAKNEQYRKHLEGVLESLPDAVQTQAVREAQEFVRVGKLSYEELVEEGLIEEEGGECLDEST